MFFSFVKNMGKNQKKYLRCKKRSIFIKMKSEMATGKIETSGQPFTGRNIKN